MFNNERSSRALWRIIFVFGFLGLLSSHVFSSPIQSEATSQAVSLVGVERPDPVGVPTKVNIGIYIFDIVAVDNLSQTFTADFFVTLSWKDTRLALGPDAGQKSSRIYRKNEIWTPQMTILNERDLDIFFDDILRVDSAGHVEYRQRFQGQLTTTLELQNFPFDTQTLMISLVSIRYTPEDLELILDERRTGTRGHFTLPGWKTSPAKAVVTTEYIDVQDRHLARIDLTGKVKRQTGYFLIKAILPLFLITIMAWAVFFIPASSLGTKIGIPTSSIFAMFLLMHRLSGLLPRISYLTRMDRLILGVITLVFITLGEAVTTSVLALHNKEKLAHRLDSWFRIIYIVLFVIFMLNAFVL